MKPIEIKLHAGMAYPSQFNIYKEQVSDAYVYRVLDEPRGYMYFYYKPRGTGTFKISRVIDKYNRELDFNFPLPSENVYDFIVYYAYNFDHPLMFCIGIMKNTKVTYKYFIPVHKNTHKWQEISQIVSHPKMGLNINDIKEHLDLSFITMGGIDIHIDKSHGYKNKNIIILPDPAYIGPYRILTHQHEDKKEFPLNRLKCNGEVISHIEIKNQVIAVYVVTRDDIGHNKPIILCIVEKNKGINGGDLHHWYSLENLSSDKWVKRHSETKFFSTTDFEYELDTLYGKFHEFEIDINNAFFNDPDNRNFAKNGELLNPVQKYDTIPNYSRHTCELKSPLPFKIRKMKIYGKEQTGLSVEVFHKFHVFCHARNDPQIPVIICVQARNTFRWYRLKHYASTNWYEYTDLEGADPDGLDYEKEFDEIYQDLFWVHLEINYEKLKTTLKTYNKYDRYLTTKDTKHKNFRKVEVINKSSYPLSVKVLLNGKEQSDIPDMKEVLSVYIFYYDGEKKSPMFICFSLYHEYNKYHWYARYNEDSNTWEKREDLEKQNPDNYTFKILKTVQNGVYEHQLEDEEQGEESSVQATVGKAVGSTFGVAGVCGVGYLVYTNAGTILSFFR